MPLRASCAFLASILCLTLLGTGNARAQTMGLLQNSPGSFEGYTLFETTSYRETFLVDHDGLLVRSWTHEHFPGLWVYLLDDGDVLRCANPGSDYFTNAGGRAGLLQRFDWDGNLIWEFLYSNEDHRHHHDVEPLPNGNVLMIAWERISFTQAVTAGRNPSLLWQGDLWPDHVIEVEPDGAGGASIVWEWHSWDHLIQDFDPSKPNYGVVADHPELINLNFAPSGNSDWHHTNSIDYNAELDQIVLSVNQFREIWIIDHGTTTEEAAGHTGGARGKGGDLLYRWGNPQTYDRGGPGDQKLFRQHDVHWIPEGLPGAGNLLVFNNGVGRPGGNYSTVEEIVTTVDANGDYPDPPAGVPHGPSDASWIYTASPPEALYSNVTSGAQRLPNGNTLICQGVGGKFREIDPSESQVWFYINPVNSSGPMTQGDPPTGNLTFRAKRYAPDFPGFAGRDLTPGAPIEIYSTTGVEELVEPRPFALAQNHPNPFRPHTTISFSLEEASRVDLRIHDVGGRLVATLVDGRLDGGIHRYTWSAPGLSSGVYHYTLRVGAASETRRMVVLR